jgi:sugar phosphate permease
MRKRPWLFYGWIILACAMTIIAMSSGTRFSFGVILKPLTDQFGWDRASVAFMASISVLISGLLQPGLGWLVDRWGPRIILTYGLLILGGGMMLTSFSTSLWHFYLAYGVLCGLGFAATLQVVAASLVSNWFVRRRGFVLSLTGSGGAIGELLVVPLMMLMVLAYGWAAYYRIAAVITLAGLFPIVLLFIRNTPEEIGLAPDGDESAASMRASGVDKKEQTGARTASPSSLRQAIHMVSAWALLYAGFA